jgi:protein-S-isoprenylcysteine O-methyltransferase Ste14
MTNQTPSQSETNGTSRTLWKAVIRLYALMIFMLAILFLAAGTIKWWEAWAYVAQALFVMIFSRAFIILKNPELALERAEAGQKESAKSWDKVIVPWVSIYLPMISWILAGLDKRFGWSPDLSDTIQIIALVLIFAGGMFGTWAIITNQFFSSHVRIQTDRGHTVVDSGPYRIMRHPGYAGGLLSWIAAPFFFGSYSVTIPTVAAIILFIVRTSKEDRTLQEELPGYKEYAQEVRYRLLPGIW